MAVDLESYEVWLLIDDDMLFPFSAHGFEFAQGRLGNLVRRSSNNLFLRADGQVYEIKRIHPLRDDLVAKTRRFFGLPYAIRVELTPKHVSLSEMKAGIAFALENYATVAEPDESWSFATLPLSETKSVIMNAESAKALYSILELPAPQDCLDLL